MAGNEMEQLAGFEGNLNQGDEGNAVAAVTDDEILEDKETLLETESVEKVESRESSDEEMEARNEGLDSLFNPGWTQLIKDLPSMCDPGLVLQDNYHKEGNTTLTYQTPMMPLADVIKRRWADVNEELKESPNQVSPFRKVDDKRYWICDEDFKKHCQSSTVDREYCIQVERDMLSENPSFAATKGPWRRTFIKKSNAIQDPLLQMCENGFKKCDESARMALRASSHAAYMLNALRNVLERPEPSRDDLLRLIGGVEDAVESVADVSSRVVARATVSRRNICMSQVKRSMDNESFEDFLSLPMESKHLFHGEFYSRMQEHKRNVHAELKRKVPPAGGSEGPKRPALMDVPWTRPQGFDERRAFGGGGGMGPPPPELVPFPLMGAGRGSGRFASNRGSRYKGGRGMQAQR